MCNVFVLNNIFGKYRIFTVMSRNMSVLALIHLASTKSLFWLVFTALCRCRVCVCVFIRYVSESIWLRNTLDTNFRIKCVWFMEIRLFSLLDRIWMTAMDYLFMSLFVCHGIVLWLWVSPPPPPPPAPALPRLTFPFISLRYKRFEYGFKAAASSFCSFIFILIFDYVADGKERWEGGIGSLSGFVSFFCHFHIL